MASGSARLVAWVLVGAGATYFLAETGFVQARAGELALVGVALAVLFHLARTVDPAWILSAGIVSTMFAGQWHELGLSTAIGPHRVLLAAGVAALLLRLPPARDRPPLRLEGVHLALAAALAYALISAVVDEALRLEHARLVLLDQFGLLPFVMFVVGPIAFATHRQRMILLGFLVATGGYLTVTAVLEKLELYSLIVPSYIGDPSIGGHFGRARGPFIEGAANGLAIYACGVAAVIAVVVWRRTWTRVAAGAVALSAPVGVLLTVTRGVWLAAAAATLIALATTPALRRFLVPAVAAGAFAVLTAFTLIPGLAADARARQNDKDPVYERQNTNAAGLRMVRDRPFFGFGWEGGNLFLEPYFELHPDIPLTGHRAGIHNIYLLYAVDLGLVGFGLWLFAVGLALGRSIFGRGPPGTYPWQVGLKALVIAWAVVGIFSPAHYAFTTYLVWTWAGLAYRPAEAPVGVPVWAPRGATT